MKILLPAIVLLLPLLFLGLGDGLPRGGGTPSSDGLPASQLEQPTIWCPIVPEHEAGMILSLAFSPDGKTIAAGNLMGMLRIYDSDTTRPVSSYRAVARPQGGCDALAFLPDGRAVASRVALDEVGLLDPATGRRLRAMQPPPFTHGLGMSALVISPDGKLLAGGYGRGEVVIWEVETGRLVRVLPPHIVPAYTSGPLNKETLAQPAGVTDLAFSPDGATLYSACTFVRVWDVSTGRERLKFDKPGSRVFRVAVSPDGSVVAAGDVAAANAGTGRTITLWDAATSQQRGEMPTDGKIRGLAFLPGSRTLVCLHEEYDPAQHPRSVVSLWDVVTTTRVASLMFDRHTRVEHLAVSSDGKRIAAGGYGDNPIFGIIQLIDTDGATLNLWRPKP